MYFCIDEKATIYLLFHTYLTYVITTPIYSFMFLKKYKVLQN